MTSANPRFGRSFLQDLNADPILPIEAASVDAACVRVGVQYLQRPVAVFADLACVLRPGAPVVVAFSHHCL